MNPNQQPGGVYPGQNQQYPQSPQANQYPQQQPSPAQSDPGQTMAIISLVLAFIGLQLIGFILGIVSYSKSKKAGFKGTLGLIATIVNVVIGLITLAIVAAIVVTTTSGINDRRQDTERQTDIKFLHGKIEAYYSQNNKYPTFLNLNDSSWVRSNMPGADQETLKDPAGTTSILTTSPVKGSYSYNVTNAAGQECSNDPGNDCVRYTLSATLDSGESYQKMNLN